MLCQSLLKLNLHVSNEYRANKMMSPLIEFAALFLDQRHWIFQITVSTQPFRFFGPKTRESFSALLFLSQTSSSIFNQFCQPLLLLTTSFARALCRLLHYLPSWFPASVLGPQCQFSTQERVIPIKLKLDRAIPLFRNLQLPSQLSPIHTQSHQNGLPDPVTLDTPPASFTPFFVHSILDSLFLNLYVSFYWKSLHMLFPLLGRQIPQIPVWLSPSSLSSLESNVMWSGSTLVITTHIKIVTLLPILLSCFNVLYRMCHHIT